MILVFVGVIGSDVTWKYFFDWTRILLKFVETETFRLNRKKVFKVLKHNDITDNQTHIIFPSPKHKNLHQILSLQTMNIATWFWLLTFPNYFSLFVVLSIFFICFYLRFSTFIRINWNRRERQIEYLWNWWIGMKNAAKRFEDAKSIYSKLNSDEIASVDLHCALICTQSKYFPSIFRLTSPILLTIRRRSCYENRSNKYRSLSFQLTINRALYFKIRLWLLWERQSFKSELFSTFN